jgi:hypothetical protein
MAMRYIMILILPILLLIVSGSVLSQESIPEDPNENACYSGGLMYRAEGEGCATEWHWQCGWYLANWLNNGGWAGDIWMPEWCNPEVLLPPQSVTTSTLSSVPVCVYWSSGNVSAYVTGVVFPSGSLSNIPTYLGTTCATLFNTWSPIANLVYAPNGIGEAQQLCDIHFPATNAISYLASPMLFACA